MPSLPLYIAKRYLFAKKSHKVVNIISMISLFGFCIGTAALVIVLSVFNGFESLITGMYNKFDPDIKITPAKGKTMIIEGEIETFLAQNPDIVSYAKVLEDQALLRYNGKQTTATIKGVSEHYQDVTAIDTLMHQGEFRLNRGENNGAVLGMGLAYTLGVGIKFINSIVVNAAKRTGNISLTNPENSFTSDYFIPTGFFGVYQPDVDNQYMLVDLARAQELFQYTDELSTIEIKVNNSSNTENLKRDIQQYLGADYLVKNRVEQRSDLYKMLRMEKWIATLISIFILIIAIFNIVGTLSMLIIEKKKDIRTLQSIGANNSLIRKIFYTEGSMVAFVGALLGLALGTIFCLLQQYYGFIKLGSSGQWIVNSYPIQLLASDLILVFFTVFLIGSASVFFPVRYICKRFEI